MSSVILSGDTSGAITLAAPAVSGTNTITLPAATGTVMVSGNMPAFSAYLSSNQSISGSTWTKIAFDTKEFDTNNNFASNRFTPTVAGYYQINSCYGMNGTTIVAAYISIYKNGTAYKQSGVNAGGYTGVSSIVYCNGSTDYIEIYGYIIATSGWGFLGGQGTTYVNGSLVRAA